MKPPNNNHMLKPMSAWYTVLVVDRLAMPLTVVLARTGITPNQVTALSMALRVIGIGLVWLGHAWPAVGAWAVGYLLDCMDGKLARLTGRVSATGKAMDMWGDITLNWLFVISVSLKELWPSHIVVFVSAVAWLGLWTSTWLFFDGVHEKLRGAMSNDRGTLIKNYAAWAAARRLRVLPVSGIEETQVIVPIGYALGILHLVMPALLVYRAVLLISGVFLKRLRLTSVAGGRGSYAHPARGGAR